MQYSLKFHGKVPKEDSFPSSIEDYYSISDDELIFSVCDGASESFDSKSWAQILSTRFIIEPELSNNWIDDAINEYNKLYDFDSLSWSKQGAFCRGSFSTLLGLQFDTENAVKITAIGDSVAFLLRGGTDYIQSFPHSTSATFRERPYLISTKSEYNRLTDEEINNCAITTWDLNSSDVILCMTDALSEWALSKHEHGLPVWEKLLSISDNSELHKLVSSERTSKEMKVDDCTLIIIELHES